MIDKSLDWTYTPLRKIVNYKKGKKPKILRDKMFEGAVPYLDIKALEKGEIRQYALANTVNLLDSDSIAMVWDGARSGWVAKGVIGGLGSTIAAITPIIVNVDYLFHFLNSQFHFLNSNTRGTGIPHVDPEKLWNIDFPLAPLAEQQRIANKLNALFHHHDHISKRLDKIPVLLKQFRERVLHQAVTGELTKDWREGKKLHKFFDSKETMPMREVAISLPNDWQWLPFSSVATVKSNLVEPNKYLNIPLIAPDNIESETGKLLSKPLVSDIMPISPKHYFEKGCIVYSKIRPYLSKLILVDFEGLCSADMYPIISDLELKYLYYFMLSDIFLSYATSAGERSVLPKINQKGLSIIPVSTPPLEEQREIVKRVDELFSIIGKIEKYYISLCTKTSLLPKEMLNKAFKGELVKQSDEDEPASVLFERILNSKNKKSK